MQNRRDFSTLGASGSPNNRWEPSGVWPLSASGLACYITQRCPGRARALWLQASVQLRPVHNESCFGVRSDGQMSLRSP